VQTSNGLGRSNQSGVVERSTSPAKESHGYEIVRCSVSMTALTARAKGDCAKSYKLGLLDCFGCIQDRAKAGGSRPA